MSKHVFMQLMVFRVQIFKANLFYLCDEKMNEKGRLENTEIRSLSTITESLEVNMECQLV